MLRCRASHKILLPPLIGKIGIIRKKKRWLSTHVMFLKGKKINSLVNKSHVFEKRKNVKIVISLKKKIREDEYLTKKPCGLTGACTTERELNFSS